MIGAASWWSGARLPPLVIGTSVAVFGLERNDDRGTGKQNDHERHHGHSNRAGSPGSPGFDLVSNRIQAVGHLLDVKVQPNDQTTD